MSKSQFATEQSFDEIFGATSPSPSASMAPSANSAGISSMSSVPLSAEDAERIRRHTRRRLAAFRERRAMPISRSV
jgi:hypothetical protein